MWWTTSIILGQPDPWKSDRKCCKQSHSSEFFIENWAASFRAHPEDAVPQGFPGPPCSSAAINARRLPSDLQKWDRDLRRCFSNVFLYKGWQTLSCVNPRTLWQGEKKHGTKRKGVTTCQPRWIVHCTGLNKDLKHFEDHGKNWSQLISLSIQMS